MLQRCKAANHFLNEGDGIEAISKYDDVEWDNNSIERPNRYVSLSRHNSHSSAAMPPGFKPGHTGTFAQTNGLKNKWRHLCRMNAASAERSEFEYIVNWGRFDQNCNSHFLWHMPQEW